MRALARRTQIEEHGQAVGTLDFVGSGGDLFVQYLLLVVLYIPTLTLYQFWFQVKMMRFFARGTRVAVGERVYGGEFEGEGAEWFVLNLLGFVLGIITLGIYYPWFIAKAFRWQCDHTMYRPLARAQPQQAFQPQHPAQT
jgi:uncharacterized membrane protein YjgN (DUF898 family)